MKLPLHEHSLQSHKKVISNYKFFFMKSISITLLMFFYFFLNSFNGRAQNYKRICVIGSSTSWGYFNEIYPRDSGYAFKLSKYYKSLNLIDTLYNIAVNGSDPYFGMPSSYSPPAGRDAPDGRFNITKAVNFVPKPDVIIVNYPSNHYDYLTYSEVLFCLQTIKDSANAKGIVCYITTTQPRDNFNAVEREKLKVLRDSIMNRFGDFAMDFYSPIVQDPEMIIKPEYSLGDGVHTNPAGQTVLENAVIDKNILYSVVPINFIEITGSSHTQGILLNWAVNGANNNDHFIIERSADGVNFIKVGDISLTEGKAFYQYLDKDAANGKNYYRVIASDRDNRKTISKIISISFSPASFADIFFDESVQKLRINLISNTLSAPSFIYIFDQSGKTVFKKLINPDNSNQFEVNLSGFPKSVYTVLVFSGKQRMTRNIKN